MAFFHKFTSGAQRPSSTPLLSIVENLNNVLNTTRGYGSPLMDFGINNMGGHMSRQDMALAVIRDVRECIQRYEPRVQLDDIVLEDDKNPLRLSFTIRCTVLRSATSLHLVFDTVLGNANVECPTDR